MTELIVVEKEYDVLSVIDCENLGFLVERTHELFNKKLIRKAIYYSYNIGILPGLKYVMAKRRLMPFVLRK